jgi:hypothetical protein
MGAGDHHRRDDKDRPILEQHSGDAEAPVAPVTDVGVMEEPLVPVDDIWAASEGYTPLRDTQGEGLFSDGGSTTFYTSFAGSFLTQLADLAEDEDDDEDESSVAHAAQVATEKLVDKVEDETDFRRLADQALMALDIEYQRTQAAHRNPSASVLVTLNTTGFQTLTSSNESVTEDSALGSCLDDDIGKFASTATYASYRKAIPNVDSEAVRRAVQNIELQNPKLRQGLEQWEQNRKQAARAVAPRMHPIIPSAPLAAFRKQTPKAIQSSSNLSRSATIAEALCRLDVQQSEKTLRIHIVGCDHVECESLERLRILFGPVVRWIGAYAEAPAHMLLDLVGPNIPQQAAAWSPLNLLPTNINALKPCLQSATLSCHLGLYHDWLSTCFNPPDLVVAFNAGVWGYRDWETTLSSVIHRNLSIPFVLTAYTIQEAEDDEDVIRKLLPPDAINRCEWEPESNPFASNKARETHSAPTGRSYRENAAWQGWRL